VVKDELIDQIKITVIATGFDETRARLAQMSKVAKETPIQGVVSEIPEKEEKIKVEEEEIPEEASEESKNDEDVFGNKFEIPAFLRKIH
jgi:hypothetical protein